MDMTALARLHAALDLMIDAGEQLDAISDRSGEASPTLQRARFLTGETRELLRALLAARPSGSGAAATRPIAAGKRVR